MSSPPARVRPFGPARLLRSAAVGVALLAPAALPALIAPATAQTVPDSVEVPAELQTLVNDYWHYGKIARYDVAAAKGQAVLDAGAEPPQVLKAFETVVLERAGRRGDLSGLDAELVRWQSVDDQTMVAVTGGIDDLLNQARYTIRQDPTFITSQIERLAVNRVAYSRALENLRRSGDLAVPFMLEYLQDPARVELHTPIRQALRDLGRLALAPLAAATETPDNQLLTSVLLALGDIGYDDAVPYLVRVERSSSYPDGVRQAARQAMARFGGGAGGGVTTDESAADLFLRLGEKFYYDRSAIQADRRVPTASVWSFADGRLQRTEVTPEIFNEIMAMRATEYALKLAAAPTASASASADSSVADQALSLWLASNYKREAELPEGQTDPTRGADQPDANYYGVTSGAAYLYAALDRALNDRDSAVALGVIRSLQRIVGQSGLQAGRADSSPLVRAMNYSDRRVRFEAAFALAGALPDQPFTGQEQVVPLLAEALGQSGSAGALLIVPTQDDVPAYAEPLTAAGYTVAGGAGAAGLTEAAARLRSVDVVVIDGSLPPEQVEQVLATAGGAPGLKNAAKLVLTDTTVNPYADRAAADALLSTAVVADPSGLAAAVEAARAEAGALAIDAESATEYATRAGDLLRAAATDTGDVYDLSAGRRGLLAALADERTEVVALAGQVLGLTDVEAAQSSLLDRAAADGLEDAVRVTLFESLAANAKRFGNKLTPQQVQSLDEVVAGAPNLEVRTAAAEARGALSLPADQAKTLILSQSKVGA